MNRGDELLATISGLIIRAREAGVPVIYVQHCGAKGHPLEEGTRPWALHPKIGPQKQDTIVRKRFCDSFHQTDLHELLQSKSITKLVVAGIQSEFCVDTACRRAFSLGYEVILVKDGHSTWDTDVLKATQIVTHHNLTLSSSFVKVAMSDSLFQRQDLKVAATQ